MPPAVIKNLRWMVKKLAQLTIWKYRPGVIGVTGSVGKTSAKLAIQTVLQSDRVVRASRGNLNNDLGLPLTVLGNWSEKELKLVSRDQPAGTARVRKAFFWLKVLILSAFRLVFVPRSKYPEILVLEYGADHPGDLKYLLNVVRPNMSVVTAIGEIPVHVEFYSGPDEVAREKSRLIEYLPVAGIAILNSDDKRVLALRERTRAHVVTFGSGKNAEVKITRFENRMETGRPTGIAFKLEYAGGSVPVRLEGVFGKTHAYAAAAAAAVGLSFGMNLVRISESLSKYSPAQSRMQVKPGINETWIIDDSYNASPLSMQAALEALADMEVKRKIAVIGDMLELGQYTVQAHKKAGREAAKAADVLITVGPRSRFLAEEAQKAGLKKTKIFSFDSAEEAKEPVRQTLRKGDIVLVKASHGMELSKIVDVINARSNTADSSFFSKFV